MNSIKAILKHIWPLLVILIIVVIVLPKDPPPATDNKSPSTTAAGKYSAEQVIELARALSPDCRVQKPTQPGSS